MVLATTWIDARPLPRISFPVTKWQRLSDDFVPLTALRTLYLSRKR